MKVEVKIGSIWHGTVEGTDIDERLPPRSRSGRTGRRQQILSSHVRNHLLRDLIRNSPEADELAEVENPARASRGSTDSRSLPAFFFALARFPVRFLFRDVLTGYGAPVIRTLRTATL